MALLNKVIVLFALMVLVTSAPPPTKKQSESLQTDSSIGLGYHGIGLPYYATYPYGYAYPFGYPYSSLYAYSYHPHGFW